MPRTRHAAQRSTGRTTAATTRAASVPVSRPENPRLESLRLKKQRSSILDAEDTPPSSLPSVVITRGRKRTSSFGATDCIPSASVSATAPVPKADGQRPRKKQKRSSSTPATSRSSQVFDQLQSHRRSRSKAGSPATDVEYVTPSRTSARLARRIHSFLNGRNSDIYTHLAGPDGTGNLLNEPPIGAVASSAPNETIGSQPVQKPRGRRRKAVDLTDESAKKDLIEEWARMRQSQGTLSLSGVDENACFSQRDTRKDDESLQLEPIAQIRSPDVHTMEPQGIILDDSLSPRMDSENALDGNRMDHIDLTLPSEGGTEQSIASSVDIEAPPPLIPTPRVGQGSPNGELARVPETTHNPDLWQHPASSQIQSVRLQEDSTMMKLAISEQAASLDSPPKDSHSVAFSPARSFDKNSMRLDSDEEFCMLDISEIFTLPWEPVASHLYVPPSLGKLISGMREQLTIEARARRRAEDLYQAELSRRISAEKMIEDLRAELERKYDHAHPDLIATRQEDGSK